MTYSAGGRFMVPVQPLLVALVAAALRNLARQTLTLLTRLVRGDAPRIA